MVACLSLKESTRNKNWKREKNIHGLVQNKYFSILVIIDEKNFRHESLLKLYFYKIEVYF